MVQNLERSCSWLLPGAWHDLTFQNGIQTVNCDECLKARTRTWLKTDNWQKPVNTENFTAFCKDSAADDQWAISNGQMTEEHPQIWEGPMAYQLFVQQWYMVNLGGIACRKLLHYIIYTITILYIYNSQKSTSNLGPVMWIIANLGRSHHIAYRLPCVQKTNVRPESNSIHFYSIAIARYCWGCCGAQMKKSSHAGPRLVKTKS